MMIDKDGNRRPMVDMTGKFYKLEDFAPEYVQDCMNASDYDPWQGKFVKNAYDATKGEKDETLDVEICMMLKAQNRVFRSRSMSTITRIAGVPISRYCTIRWIAGSSVRPLAVSV